MISIVMVIEVEQIEQVADGRHVARHVGVVVLTRIGQVIEAAVAQRGIEHPVPFDKLYKRGMLAIVWLIWPPVEKGETAIIGMRGPVPKKSTGWMKPES